MLDAVVSSDLRIVFKGTPDQVKTWLTNRPRFSGRVIDRETSQYVSIENYLSR